MTFKKWPSIENHYRSKEISWWLNHYPELQDEIFVITEKIHGSNLQLYFEPNKPYKVGTRTRFLSAGDKFYDVWNALERYQDLIEMIQYVVDGTGKTHRLFGELFGGKIQKGVQYQAEHKISFFGLMVDDVLQSFRTFLELMMYFDFNDYVVPSADRFTGLQKALDYDTEFDSLILRIDDNICEGVVIQPYNKVYESNGSYFLLKKKNESFKEKAHAKTQKPVNTELTQLNIEFRRYITDNRLQGIFSKYGEIQEPKQIGQYISYMMEDAKADFLKGNPDVAGMNKKDQKQVFNVGGTIAQMLKGYL